VLTRVAINTIIHFCSSRKAAKTAHPDKGGSEDKMAAVNEAYEVLSDPGEQNFKHFSFVFFSPFIFHLRTPNPIRQRRRPERPDVARRRWATIPAGRASLCAVLLGREGE
jgi:curved DNA-binding protein CbpA